MQREGRTMTERFDAIVVGAGPAGNAAAYTLAKGGLSVLQIERGETPGTKNVQGAILYSHALEDIIPDFRKDAPLERKVIEQRMWLMDEGQACTGMSYRDDGFAQAPGNRYTILRARFDRWLSEKVEQAGALVINETTVTGLLKDESGKVVGVQTERAGGEIEADAVILADGVNSLVGQRAGLREDIKLEHSALAVKETLFLSKEIIEERFGIKNDEGVVIEIAGRITHGMVGTGFLYTNKDSIAIGMGCMLGDLATHDIAPYQLIEGLKRHPMVRPLIAGAEMKEYAAHLIPEGGYKAVPKLFGDGWMLVGDSAGLVNGVHREGSNLAMTSGRIAAETLINVKKRGAICDAKALSAYKAALDDSYVIRDMKKYANVPGFLHGNPDLLSTYPTLVNRVAREMLTVDGIDKRTKQKRILQEVRERRSLLGLLGDAYRFWRAFR
jgi:electron transfer flavoprotein-quinone oxidoreductase